MLTKQQGSTKQHHGLIKLEMGRKLQFSERQLQNSNSKISVNKYQGLSVSIVTFVCRQIIRNLLKQQKCTQIQVN